MDDFHWVGTVPELIERLKSLRSKSGMSGPPEVNTDGGRPSGPGLEEGRGFDVSLIISLRESGMVEREEDVRIVKSGMEVVGSIIMEEAKWELKTSAMIRGEVTEEESGRVMEGIA